MELLYINEDNICTVKNIVVDKQSTIAAAGQPLTKQTILKKLKEQQFVTFIVSIFSIGDY